MSSDFHISSSRGLICVFLLCQQWRNQDVCKVLCSQLPQHSEIIHQRRSWSWCKKMNIIPRRQSFDRQKLILSFRRLKKRLKVKHCIFTGFISTASWRSLTFTIVRWGYQRPTWSWNSLKTVAAENKRPFLGDKLGNIYMWINPSGGSTASVAPWPLALLSDQPTCHNQRLCVGLHHLCRYVSFIHTCFSIGCLRSCILDEVWRAACLLTDVLPPAGVTSWLSAERRSLRAHVHLHLHVLQDETGGSEHWLLLLLVQLISCYLLLLRAMTKNSERNQNWEKCGEVL